MKLILINIAILFCEILSAQNTATIWYFGNQAGLDFSSGLPVAITNSQMYTQEGCSSICDQNGDILFYTNGLTVWNKNHVFMQNGTGLYGHQSATQSSLVVPNPSNNGLFYIFTVDAIENNLANGFNYSIVDINQNGGLGEVTSKNNLLFTPSCEKICAVKQNNDTDYWVIAHQWNSDAFYVYPITTEGIGSPIITNIGLTHSGNIRNAIGQMKSSPQGDRIALNFEVSHVVEILDFNDSTGELSNPINFTCPNINKTYGIEFSPDGTKLYVSSWTPSDNFYQFSLESGTSGGIVNSAVNLYSGGYVQRSALQLGPDNKIYVARRDKGYIGVISEPNQPGLSCNYIDEAVYLSGKTSVFGLPNYIAGFFSPLQQQDFLFDLQCSGDTSFFYIQNTNTLNAVLWNFGDPSSTNNTSTGYNPFHVYNSPGSYTVTLISWFTSNMDTVIKTIEIQPTPLIDLGNDTIICSNDGTFLNAGEGFETYHWQDGSGNAWFHADTSGLYWVEVTNEYGCKSTDSIYLEIYPKPEVNLGNDTLICMGDSLILFAGNGFSSYLWSTGGNEQEITIKTAGSFWVEVSNEYGCSNRDTIVVQVYPTAFEELNLGPDTSICQGNFLALNAGAGYTFYQWMNNPGNSSDSLFVVDTAGTYFVYVSNPCSEGWDTIHIDVIEVDDIELGNDTALCDGDYLLLDSGFGFTSYIWQDGSVNSVYSASSTGWYWVEATDLNGCVVSDSIHLDFMAPEPDIGPDTAFCQGVSVSFNAESGFASYLWQDGSTLPYFNCNESMLVWCRVSDTLGCMGTDSAYAEVTPIPMIDLGGDLGICPGDTAMISPAAVSANVVYSWQDGSYDSVLTTTTPGIYWLMVSNQCGSSVDSVVVSELQLPDVFIGNDTILSVNTEIQLDAGDGYYTYFWSDGSEQQWMTVEEAGTYWVKVTDGNCVNTDTIIIEPVDCELFVPLVFTPNGDLANDHFYAETSAGIYNFNLRVLNRWGEKIWETSNKFDRWDGNRNGHPAAEGVYYWIVNYNCKGTPQDFVRKGSVTLLR